MFDIINGEGMFDVINGEGMFDIINKLSVYFSKIAARYGDDEELYEINFKDKVNELSKLNPYPFSSWFGSDGRAYYDIDINNTKDRELSVEDIEIIDFLKQNGYTNIDYYNGYAEKGGRKLRIGKILDNLSKADDKEGLNKDLKNDKYLIFNRFFESSPYRKLRNRKLKVVFSQNPHDIAKMSTGRNWTSCFNLNSGVNSQYCLQEVKEGGFVAYLIDADDLDIKHPYSRIYIRRFDSNYSNDSLAIPEEKMYGESIPAFLNFVKDFLLKKQQDKLNNFNTYSMTGGRNSTVLAKDFFIPTKIQDSELENLNKNELFLLLNKKRYVGENGAYNSIEELKEKESGEDYRTFSNYDNINIIQNIIDKYLNQLTDDEIKQIKSLILNIDRNDKFIEFVIKIFEYLEFDDLTLELCESVFKYLPDNVKDKLSNLILDKFDFYFNGYIRQFQNYLKFFKYVKYISDDVLDKIFKRTEGIFNFAYNFDDYIGDITNRISDESSIKIGEKFLDQIYYVFERYKRTKNGYSLYSLSEFYSILYNVNLFVKSQTISEHMRDMLEEMLSFFITNYNKVYNEIKKWSKTSNDILLMLKDSYDIILSIKAYLESNK
jgi:hypothetical protein